MPEWPADMPKAASSDERFRGDVAKAQELLNATLAEMAPSLPPQHEGPRRRDCPNGQPYVVIRTIAGVTSFEKAIADWRLVVAAYVAARRKGHTDVLWWRIRPEIDADILSDGSLLWYVYSRLALTHDVVVDAAA